MYNFYFLNGKHLNKFLMLSQVMISTEAQKRISDNSVKIMAVID
jgi:hypothetical protein